MPADHSQFGEQAAILAWADEVESQGLRGSFVDVGAYDGRTFSNTYALAQRGWGGVCIEPAPDAYKLLEARYRSNPVVSAIRAVASPAAYADVRPMVDLLWSVDEPWSSTDLGRDLPCETRVIQVPEISLEQVAQLAAPRPRFASIDAEGESWALFLATRDDWDCVCVEADQGVPAAVEWLVVNGWRVRLATHCNVVASAD